MHGAEEAGAVNAAATLLALYRVPKLLLRKIPAPPIWSGSFPLLITTNVTQASENRTKSPEAHLENEGFPSSSVISPRRNCFNTYGCAW